MVLVGNAPLFVLGWRYLGGKRFAFRTAFAIVAFSVMTDVIRFLYSTRGDDQRPGIEFTVWRFDAWCWTGIGISRAGDKRRQRYIRQDPQSPFWHLHFAVYLITDAVIVLLAGFVFDWEHALYGLVMIYVSGLAAEVTVEGTDIFRTAMIVTNCPQEVAREIMTVWKEE